MDLVTYALCRRYIKKVAQGLGCLRGSPCKVESITPIYSALDSTQVIANKVVLKYQGNPGIASTLDIPPIFETKTMDVLNGRGIHKAEYDHRDREYFYYKIINIEDDL